MTDLEKAQKFLNLDLSFSIMATKSSVPKGSLSDFKNGKRELSTAQYETVKKMANAYDRENEKKFKAYQKESVDYIAQQVTVADLRTHMIALVNAATAPVEVANALNMLTFYMIESYKKDDVMEKLQSLVEKGTTWN